MKKCPCCGKDLNKNTAMNARCRLDNRTKLCSKCGEIEGLIDAGYETSLSMNEVEMYQKFKEKFQNVKNS